MHEKKKREKKRGIFCRTESVAMTPKSRDHMPTTSLWVVAAKCQLELRRRNWYFAQETHKDTAVSVWACQAVFWKYRNIVSASKQTPCGIPWGLRNRAHWSARYKNGRDAALQESQLVWTV